MKDKEENIQEEEKKITIERLRQAPPTMKVSFGTEGGEFIDRDEMIKQVEKDTETGKKIIKLQMNYLKAFKLNLVGG